MAIYIGYESALLLYASPRCAGLAKLPAASVTSIANAETSIPAARRKAVQAFNGVAGLSDCPIARIDVLAPTKSRRTPTAGLLSHACTTSLPSGAFVEAARDVFLATPELCFLQMAQTLSPIRLMVLGMAMCGRYWPADVYGHMLKTDAMTSAEHLVGFLEDAPAGADGVRRARLAASWIEDNAWSPMETSTYLLLCLPRTMGGYGVPRPELNREQPLTPESQAMVNQETCFVDLCWHKSRYGIEYYGVEYHRDTERDLARELALKHEGMEIQPIAYRQIKNAAARDEVVKQVAKHVGMPMRKASSRMLEKRQTLLHEAFARGRYVDGAYELELPHYALPSALC